MATLQSWVSQQFARQSSNESIVVTFRKLAPFFWDSTVRIMVCSLVSNFDKQWISLKCSRIARFDRWKLGFVDIFFSCLSSFSKSSERTRLKILRKMRISSNLCHILTICCEFGRLWMNGNQNTALAQITCAFWQEFRVKQVHYPKENSYVFALRLCSGLNLSRVESRCLEVGALRNQ